MTTSTTKVAIIHPWLPQYRVQFFTVLQSKLRKHGIQLDVYYGETPPEWRGRSDSASASGCTQLKTTWVGVGGRSLSYKHLGEIQRNGPYNLIILEQAIRNLETYLLLVKHSRQSLAFWGHGKNYTVSRSRIETRAKDWVTSRGQWFFGYTVQGVESVVAKGFQRQRTTVVYNSTDTQTLRADLESCDDDAKTNYRRLHSLTGPTALYIGGLDEAKRIPFLLEAAVRIREFDPNFSLIIGGSGDLKDAVIRASERYHWVKYIGPVFGRDKALAISASDLLLIPGRVGLVAVDSIVSGLPLVTTDWPYHAPEYEYLQNGVNCLETADTLEAFASSTAALLDNRELRAEFSTNLQKQATDFSAENMASNFAVGIISAVGFNQS